MGKTDLKDRIKRRITPSDVRRILEDYGFSFERATIDTDDKASEVLGPKELGEGETPNFSVDLSTGLVKDWGSSDYRGDLFHVVADMERLDVESQFPDVLRIVAEKIGVSTDPPSGGDTVARTPEEPPTPPTPSDVTTKPGVSKSTKAVASLQAIQERHERLMGDEPAAQCAREYLHERGISEDALRSARIGLGRAYGEWQIIVPAVNRMADPPQCVAVKRLFFQPDTENGGGEWMREKSGKKKLRNMGRAALIDWTPNPPPEGPLLVCEGETDALAALSHGYSVVAGTSGANTWLGMWSAYVARLGVSQRYGVIIAYDGDDAGRSGASDVSASLRTEGVDGVRVVPMPDGMDVNDVLAEHGRAGMDLLIGAATPQRARFSEEEANSVPVSTYEAPTEYEPMPLDTLPDVLRGYVRAAASAIDKNAPPSMVAVPMLPVVAGAIGSHAQVELKSGWTEGPTLWTVVVAPSGSTKSPAFHKALAPVYRKENEAKEAYEEEMRGWQSTPEDDRQEKDKPTRDRYRIGDPTPEAVAKVLDTNPRGVVLARDELAGWIGSFDRYSNGAADAQFWIEIWGRTPISRDRAGEGNTTIAEPAVSVTGTTQPGTLRDKLGSIHFDTGFAQRLLLCNPPMPRKTWSEAGIDEPTKAAFEGLLNKLYDLPKDIVCPISTDAKRLWADFYESENAVIYDLPEGAIRQVYAKSITYAARLALTLHLCAYVSEEADSLEITRGSMEAAIRLAQWLRRETIRVHEIMGLENASLEPIDRFFRALPEGTFKTADAGEIATEEGVPRSTMYEWLSELQENRRIAKIKRGLYQKP